MIAAVTGILVHRHLLADLFTLRLGRDALLKRRDLHVVAGSWNLPFALILAFTGSFFSFASSVGLPAIAMVTFGGDQAALIDTLYSTARPENKASAPLANIEAMLADVRRRNNAEPNYVSISHYGRADATVSINTVLPGDELVYSTFVYDGTTGALISEQPPLGKISVDGRFARRHHVPASLRQFRRSRIQERVGCVGHGGRPTSRSQECCCGLADAKSSSCGGGCHE